MATSGSKSVTVTSYDTLKFSWELDSQSVADNTSKVSWKMTLTSTSSGKISSTASKDWSVTVNGTKYSGTNSVGIAASTTKTLASGTTTIAHNADGTKTFSYSFSQEFGITFSGSSIGTKSGSGSSTLTTIPRASSVSATAANIESASTITITRASSSFTHTLSYEFGSLSGTIATKTTSTSVSWTLPSSFYAQLSSTATSKTGTITCKTYNGSTLIGTKTCSFTAKTSSTKCKPTIAPTVTVATTSNTYKLTGSQTKFIKGYSDPTATVNATAKNGATISSYKITCGNTTITAASGSINNISNTSVVFTATDSRGYSTSQTVTVTLVDYVSPTCILDASMTVDGVITINISGKYFNGNFGAVANSIQVGYKYKAGSGDYSSWVYLTPTLNGNNYTATATITGLDYRQTYTLQAWMGDAFYVKGFNDGVYTNTKSVKAFPVFDWGEEDFNFNVAVNISPADAVNEGLSFNGTQVLRHKEDGMTILSSEGNTLRLRPNGNIHSEGEVTIAADGSVKFNGTTSIFPVGSVYTTSENTSPASYLGGTWERIGKRYTSYSNNLTSLFTINSTNTTEVTNCYVIRNGETIRVRLQVKNKVALSDTQVTLGTFNLETLGVSGLYASQYVLGQSDGGEGIVEAYVGYDSGDLIVIDVIHANTANGSVAAGSSIYFDFIILVNQARMLDSVCNQFIWQRTA